jgi:hypothetical protein
VNEMRHFRVVVERDESPLLWKFPWRQWRWSVEMDHLYPRTPTRWDTWKTGRARSFAAALRRARRHMFTYGISEREEFIAVRDYRRYPSRAKALDPPVPARHLTNGEHA